MPTGLPPHTPVDHTPRERMNVVVDDEESLDALQAVSSSTAQQILAALDEPATASDVASRIDTSVQNATYHLDRLRETGLVEAVDTWYSAKGTEMTVYALATEEFVVRLTR